MVFNCAVGVTGATLIRELPVANRWGRFIGAACSAAYAINFPLVLSMVSGNVAGFTKKSIVSAVVFTAYCAGNIIGPQLFFDRETPSYTSAFLSIMICLGSTIVLSLALRLHLIMENKRRDGNLKSNEDTTISEAERDYMINMADQTDKEQPRFRYVL